MTLDPNQQEAMRRYLADHVETATPAQRLLMLFDHLLQDLAGARAGFEEMNIEVISNRLIHAESILFALRDPLDVETELGRSLASLYSFCIDRLIIANIKKWIEPLDEVQPLLEKIATANRVAAAAMANPLARSGV